MFKPWDLSELTLDQNPLCSKYKSQTEYIRYCFNAAVLPCFYILILPFFSDARDYFPNLLILVSFLFIVNFFVSVAYDQSMFLKRVLHFYKLVYVSFSIMQSI